MSRRGIQMHEYRQAILMTICGVQIFADDLLIPVTK